MGTVLSHLKVGDLDLEIIQRVQAKARDNAIEEISSDSNDDKLEVVPPSLKEMIEACQKLEGIAFWFVQRMHLIM